MDEDGVCRKMNFCCRRISVMNSQVKCPIFIVRSGPVGEPIIGQERCSHTDHLPWCGVVRGSGCQYRIKI